MLPALSTSIIVVCSIAPVISTLAVLLRFYSRRLQCAPLKADDWLILPALVFLSFAR